MNYRVAMIKGLGHVYINTILTWSVKNRPVMSGGRLTGVAKFTAFTVYTLVRRFLRVNLMCDFGFGAFAA
jgi:hypothetical protein